MGMLMRRHANRKRQQQETPAPAGTPLPEDLPGRAALVAAGLTTIETVTAHADLTTVKGIGQATADRIHEHLTPAPEPEKNQEQEGDTEGTNHEETDDGNEEPGGDEDPEQATED